MTPAHANLRGVSETFFGGGNPNIVSSHSSAEVFSHPFFERPCRQLSEQVYGRASNLEPNEAFTWTGAGAVEFLYTFMLVFVVLRAAVADVNPDSKEYFPLAIGFVIVAGGYAAGPISGGAFNPAVAIGVDVASAWQGVYYCGVYTLFEFAGAAAAALVHKALDSPPGVTPSMAKKCVSEFIGTYFLILTVGLNVLMKSPAGALSIAASLMCMIYALGGVSGANFNPAVLEL